MHFGRGPKAVFDKLGREKHDRNLTLEEHREFLKGFSRGSKGSLSLGESVYQHCESWEKTLYLPHAFVIEDTMELGFLMRCEIIWNRASGGSRSMAWGGWLSAKNPPLRDIHEYTPVFSKGTLSRNGFGRKSAISREKFLEFIKSI